MTRYRCELGHDLYEVVKVRIVGNPSPPELLCAFRVKIPERNVTVFCQKPCEAYCGHCKNEIDPEVCHCGEAPGGCDNHIFIPMGCDCSRMNILDYAIVVKKGIEQYGQEFKSREEGASQGGEGQAQGSEPGQVRGLPRLGEQLQEEEQPTGGGPGGSEQDPPG